MTTEESKGCLFVFLFVLLFWGGIVAFLWWFA